MEKEKRVSRTKNLKGLNVLAYFHIDHIFKFLYLTNLLQSLKISKTFNLALKRSTWYDKYKSIIKDIKKLKTKYTIIDYIKNDAKLINSYIKKYKLSSNDALIIFSGLIYKLVLDEYQEIIASEQREINKKIHKTTTRHSKELLQQGTLLANNIIDKSPNK